MAIELNYIEKGFGTPLVLLHGNGESNEFFINQIDYFSLQYRVIVIDTRGHGKSPRGMLPFTLEQFAKDLKIFLDSKNIEKANILGFSDGANIALIFTLKYPEYVNKLILNSANLFPGGLNKSFLFSIRLSYLGIAAASKIDKKLSKRKELLALMVKEPNINPIELKKIKSPTLIIAGTHDLIKKSHTKVIADSISNSNLCFISGDHAVARHNSVEFNKAVEKFLENDISSDKF